MSGIRRFGVRVALATAVAGLSVFGPPAVQAQTPAPAAPERRLSIMDAVELAIKQNSDLEVVRINPAIQDVSIDQARAQWAPTFTTLFQGDYRDNPPNSFLSGGQETITNNQNILNFGFGSALPWWGSSYRVGWENYRATTNNAFANFSPQVGSTATFNFTLPLLRDRSIDLTRQSLQVSSKNREISDVLVREAVATTTRFVKNAYWDLVFSINSLEVQRLSLDLAQRSLKENRARVEIGTMAPIDIVQAEAEVAQREEAVIVAEAAIARSEDALRALIFTAHTPEEWEARLVPTDAAVFTPLAVDLRGSVREALDVRTDIVEAQKTLEANDITIRYLRNQLLPDLTAVVDYGATGIGGDQFVRGEGFPGPIIDTITKPYSDVLKDVIGAEFPSWTFTVQLGIPLGNSTQDVNLARARLQNQQSLRQLDASRIRVATEVREAARQVTTNGKRVEATRASRALAEKRLEAEEKKFQAGMTTNFFVLQALIDYLKSVVDFETAKVAPLNGAVNVISVSPGGGFTSGSQQQQQQQ